MGKSRINGSKKLSIALIGVLFLLMGLSFGCSEGAEKLLTLEAWGDALEREGIIIEQQNEKMASLVGALRGIGYITDDGIGIEVYEYTNSRARAQAVDFFFEGQYPEVANGNLKLYFTRGPIDRFDNFKRIFMEMQ